MCATFFANAGVRSRGSYNFAQCVALRLDVTNLHTTPAPPLPKVESVSTTWVLPRLSTNLTFGMRVQVFPILHQAGKDQCLVIMLKLDGRIPFFE